MSAHPWLAKTPWPTRQLSRDELAQRIDQFLATHWMGVLCTSGRDGPIGSPLEFYAEGMVVYMLPQPGSPKLKAIARDPRICLAAHGENCGWASIRGAQLFGKAELLDPGTPAHRHGMSIFRWQASSVQLGRALDQPPNMQLLRLDPDRIVYTEQWLRKDGFGPRQIWLKDPDAKARPLQYGH